MYVNLTDNDANPVLIAGVAPGQEFSVWVPGDLGGGTLSILADEGDGTKTAIWSTASADDDVVLVNLASNGGVYYQLTGATTPDVNLNINPVVGESR